MSPGEQMQDIQTPIPTDKIPAQFRAVMTGLCRVADKLALTIARGSDGQSLGTTMGQNADGDQQKALDILADEAFAAEMKNCAIRWYASEEQEKIVGLDPKGTFALAIDPLDGSSNIDVNVSIGTIFSIFIAKPDAEASFLRPANEQQVAGYFIYGPQTALVVTFGNGVMHFIMDPITRKFTLADRALTIPEDSHEYAINASNYRHWHDPVRAYVDDCLAGTEGPRSKDFNMRWVASLVAETHRILARGGVFLYPGDKRDGYANGRLRMLYECAPIAMLIAQAGGKATDGSDEILNKTASALHARTPFVFGSRQKVERIAAYHDLPDNEAAALFGARGLFRT
jgi:fructose-1,6-bisphosphatase I